MLFAYLGLMNLQIISKYSCMKKYRITLTEEQLRLIADCVEDCHRFACGQTELWNTTLQLGFMDAMEENK